MRSLVYRLTVTEETLRRTPQTLCIQTWARVFLGLFVITALLSLHDTRGTPRAPASPKAVTFPMLPAVVQISPTEFQISRLGMIQRLTQELLQVYQVLDEELTPLFERDRLAGYRVGNVKRCALFQELGVRNGDIIRAVNGEPLQSLWEMYLRFRYVDHAKVMVERQGHLVTLDYRID